MEAILASIIDKIPFTLVGLLAVILFGYAKMAQCKRELHRDGRAHVAEKVSHLRELLEQKISDQERLLKIQIDQNREILKNIKKTR